MHQTCVEQKEPFSLSREQGDSAPMGNWRGGEATSHMEAHSVLSVQAEGRVFQSHVEPSPGFTCKEKPWASPLVPVYNGGLSGSRLTQVV